MSRLTEIKRAARREAAAGRLGMALDAYRKAIRTLEAAGEPVEPLLHVRMGDIHHRLGHERMAVASYCRAADGYRAERMVPNTIAVWKRLLRIFPQHLWVHRELAELYLEQGLLAEARRHLLGFVDAADSRGEPRAAIRALEDFVDAQPDGEVAMVLRAYRALQRQSAETLGTAEEPVHLEAGEQVRVSAPLAARRSKRHLRRILEIQPDPAVMPAAS
jgi:tetratricopeptide (TPR) repeat protein